MKHHSSNPHKGHTGVIILLATMALVSTLVIVDGSSAQSMPFGGTDGGEQLDSDPFLGDWEGEWIDPKGIMKHNSSLVAQIIPRGGNRYQINILEEFDHRCALYALINAEATDGTIRFEEGHYSGTITPALFSGKGILREDTGRFEMKKVTRLSPTLGAEPPARAIVLFDGTSLDQWQPGGRNSDRPINWELDQGVMRIQPDPLDSDGPRHSLQTRLSFRDCQVHIEFRLPLLPGNTGQRRANSGVSVGGYEIQVLDSYGLPGYYNECGALYKRAAPMVNMCAPPLQWQTYDITFHARRFDEASKKISNPRITVLHNGVLIHKDREIISHGYRSRTDQTEPVQDVSRPINLQNHGHPIEYRNIWAVDLSRE